MDVEFWAARVRSTKHINAVQASRLLSGNPFCPIRCVVWIWDWIELSHVGFVVVDTHLCLDDSEGDEDVRATFPCPFCYVDVEVSLLSTHFQEEHCFDVKNAVRMPSVRSECRERFDWTFYNATLSYVKAQPHHAFCSTQRRRKSQRSGFLTKGAAALGTELRELSSFLGVTAKTGRENAPDLAPDPLFSPFLSVVPSGAQEPSSAVGEPNQEAKSIASSKSHEAQQEDYQEKSERAEFSQQLIMSTIF
ncbi:hypothetical protein Syun_024240 [Stephania yunnanensis]|uniref:Drought induced 19 protein type zinc-binding domain-containing protein n=1 Tax=Stephania yunnanensis TaxID=152371 RepID=A0AAP0I403_9MAGN